MASDTGGYAFDVESASMGPHLLAIFVVSLYVACATLVLVALVRQRLQARRERRRQRQVEQLRPLFEAYVLDGTPLPRTSLQVPASLLDLALRYAAIVRGREATPHRRLPRRVSGSSTISSLRLGPAAPGGAPKRPTHSGVCASTAPFPGLIAALDDPHEDVRTVAARALAGVGDPRAIAPLAHALADPSRWTLSLVAESLMAMGPEVVPPLLDLLSHDEHNVRVAVDQDPRRDPRPCDDPGTRRRSCSETTT